MEENVKKVSKKKIIFVEIDEEITGIFEKIEKLNYKEIYLVVPKRAILLQSIVNLKILKHKLADIEKSMAIITSDTNGMKLAQQAEIKVFDQWNVEHEAGKNGKDKDATFIKPIAATSNEIDSLSPSRLPQKKSSIFEVVRTLRGKDKGFSLRSYVRDRKKNRLEKEPFHFFLTAGNKRFITGLVLTSVLIFGVIAYVALPGATVYIEPASSVVTKGVNIVLEGNPSDTRSLKAYSLTSEVELTISHSASGIVSEGQNAVGYLTIINTNNQEKPLVEETRFQTEDGIVFRLQEAVTVPAGSELSPGTIDAYVVADTLDANGIATGERGNIGPSTFFLPGLLESSRANLYAESHDYMSGGTTLVSTFVTEDDLIAASEKLETQLQEKALSSLRKEALSEGNSGGVELSLLEDSDVIEYGTAKIDVPYGLVGDEMSEFEITGSVGVEGVAYESGALLAILKQEIASATTPGKQLIRIDESSVSINVLEANNALLYYKFTAQIQGIEEYEIDPGLEGGGKLAKKIKEHIAGKTIAEAENYVQNLPEVNSVEIKLWPGWSPTIPTLPENIKIKSMSGGEAVGVE